MSTLAAALAWAARGYRVFPLAEGTKDQPLVSHVAEATTDTARIRMWWTDPLLGAERDYNIGYDTSDLNLVDIDCRNGKQGFANYLALDGHFDTTIVRTPSGGMHCLFTGEPAANRVGILGKDSGLDIRSFHGYALAPGSYSREGPYTLEVDLPPASVPPEIKAHLRPPMARPDNTTADLEFVETPTMVARALAFLQTAQPAVEGYGGDALTFQTCARLRDFGVSEATAFRLLAEQYNPRCAPPWDPIELRAKVANAYAYGTAQFGIMAPELSYGGIKIPEGSMLVEDEKLDGGVTFPFGNAIDALVLPPRPWILTRLLMRGNVTALVGAGSAGKSVLLLEIAAHLAMGQGFMNFTAKVDRPLKSIIYNEEDDLDELSRRLWAICHQFKFDFPLVRSRISLSSRKQIALKLTNGDPPVVNNEHVGALIDAASAPDVGFVALDPLVALHQSREEDNIGLTYIMGTLRMIAERADVAVAIAAHTSKPSGTASKLSDMYAARGAGAIINTSRIAYNLASPNAMECELYGLDPNERTAYVAMMDAKMNMALAAAQPRWLKKKSIKLPNGDEVGVLDPFDMAAKAAMTASTHAEILALAMKGKNVASCTVAEAADILRTTDPLTAKLSMKDMQAKIMAACSSPVITTEGTIKIVREMHSGHFKNLVVLE